MEDEKEQTVYRQKPDMWERLGNPSVQIYSDQLWWIYSEREKKEVQMDETNRVRRENLIPDAEKVLDQNDILIVTTMHLSNETTGRISLRQASVSIPTGYRAIRWTHL